MTRARVASNTIVIKLGTSSIVHEKTHQPLLSTLSRVVETVIHLKARGHKVVLVSSGAIGVGLKRMELPAKPKSLSGKQALAAIGQGRLIALWDNLFSQLGQPIAQVLLTRGDISDRTRYLNAVNTFKELLSMGVIPIVNENDTISVSEIKFGDNDTLSAITSSMIQADYLFLLTDVDGLYTSNPRKNPDARLLEVVSSVAAIRSEVSTATLGSNLGTGGMETKLVAAEIATGAGITTIITSSQNPENIVKIIDYHSTVTMGSDFPRPPHTMFSPSPTPMRDVKSWTSHTLTPSGSVVIDTGAHHVLSRRESGGRLLPAGVIGVEGSFASHQAVRICIRRKVGVDGVEDPEKASIEYLEGRAATTPTMLSRSPSKVDLGPPSRSPSEEAEQGFKPGDDRVLPTHVEHWELEEVGRGLANYNSAQIETVKGVNSSHISQLLGYADSDYVVENITIRVPPGASRNN